MSAQSWKRRTQHIRVLESVQHGEDIETGAGTYEQKPGSFMGDLVNHVPELGYGIKHKTKPLN